MNCFDDLFISNNYEQYNFKENIDYLSNDIHISNECLVKCYKQLKFDISVIIPSTQSIRLKNIVWRRLNKNLGGLKEIDPTIINWYKDYDINWCYGPKYNSNNLLQELDDEESITDDKLCMIESDELEQTVDDEFVEDVDADNVNNNNLTHTISNLSTDSECDSDSVLSDNSSNSSINSTSYSNSKIDNSKLNLNLNSKPKSVKFNFVINSREIINGISIDYDFLDNNMLVEV